MRSMSSPEVLIFTMAFVIFPMVMTIAGVMVQRFRSQERLRAIEKGLPLPQVWPSPSSLTPEERTANLRVAGIICVAVGLGLFVLFTALAETVPAFPRGVAAVSAIPFLVGLGLLLEYRMRRKESSARERSAPR